MQMVLIKCILLYEINIKAIKISFSAYREDLAHHWKDNVTCFAH